MHVPWKRLAQIAVLVLTLGFLAAVVWRQWSTLQTYQWQVAPGWAILGIIALEMTWLFEAGTWNAILGGLGGHLRFGRAARAWFLSNLMRYIPGNIWQFVGMVEFAAGDGVPRTITLTSIVLHQVILTMTGLALAALYFAVAGYGQALAGLRPLLLVIPLGLLLLQPRILERGLNAILTVLKRPPVRITLTWAGIWLLILRYTVVWFAEGLSFAVLVRALVPIGWPAVPQLVAAWVAAYIAGYLSMLTPSGLGVREAAMVLLLAPALPASVAAVVAVAVRLFMVVAEILGAGAILLAQRGRPVVREDVALMDGSRVVA